MLIFLMHYAAIAVVSIAAAVSVLGLACVFLVGFAQSRAINAAHRL